MMKKILHTLFSVSLVLSITACSGSMPSGWQSQKAAEGPASAAPSPITADAINTSAADSQSVAREILSDPRGVNTVPAPAAQATTDWSYSTQGTNAQPTAQQPVPTPSVTTYPTDSYASTQPVAAPAPAGPSVKVALLVPLSGKNADLGQAMLQSAQLALFDMEYDRIELVP